MRAVVQRASRASVRVEGEVVGALEAAGLVVLVGVATGDTDTDARLIARKCAELRILSPPGAGSDAAVSAQESGAPILVVSQFTLLADTSRGRRPSWSAAARGDVAEPLVDLVVTDLRSRGITVATGTFGAHMQLELTGDGPVTILLDSSSR